MLTKTSKKIKEDEYKDFYYSYNIKILKIIVETIQQKMIRNRLKNHFLNQVWPYVDLVEGFFMPETTHIWTKEKAVLRFVGDESHSRISFKIAPPKSEYAPNPYVVKIIVPEKNLEQKYSLDSRSGTSVKFSLSATEFPIHVIIKCNQTFSPILAGSKDIRHLGVSLRDIEIT